MSAMNPSKTWTRISALVPVLLVPALIMLMTPVTAQSGPASMLVTAPSAGACLIPLMPAGEPAQAPAPPKAKHAQQQARDVKRLYELPRAKAEALFALLAPDDVKVFVGPDPEGVKIKGTAQEAKILDAFVNLLTREEGQAIDDPAAFIEKLRKTWNTERSYKLPGPKADALFNILAFPDVPVLVSRSDSGVHVEASENDQKVLAGVVGIMHGKEFGKGKGKQPKGSKEGAGPVAGKHRSKGKDVAPDKPCCEQDQKAKQKKQGKDVSAAHGDLARRVDELERQARKLQHTAQKLQQQLQAHATLLTAEGLTGHGPKGKPAKMKRVQEAEAVVHDYELPKWHADNLFKLFAPNDIKDVVVSREGNVVTIRASAKDHKTIKRLVEILTRGHLHKTKA